MTDRQIKNELFGLWAEANMVRPRVSDMKREGWIVEVGAVRGKGGRQERLVWIVTPEERVEGSAQVQMAL